MLSQQLLLPFGFNVTESLAVSKDAKDFVTNSMPYSFTNKIQYLQNSERLMEIVFPQLTRPWNPNSYQAFELYTRTISTYLNWCGEDIPPPTSGVTHLFFSDSARAMLSGLVNPGYLRMETRRNGKIYCDYGFVIYDRPQEQTVKGTRRKVNHNKILLKLYIHVEYLLLPGEKRHAVDPDNSYVVAASSLTGAGYTAIKYTDIENYQDDMLLAMPWFHFGSFNNNNDSQWYRQYQENIKHFLGEHFIIEGGTNSKDVSKAFWQSIDYLPRSCPSHYNMFTRSVIEPNFKDFVNTLLSEGIKGFDLKLTPGFYKFALTIYNKIKSNYSFKIYSELKAKEVDDYAKEVGIEQPQPIPVNQGTNNNYVINTNNNYVINYDDNGYVLNTPTYTLATGKGKRRKIKPWMPSIASIRDKDINLITFKNLLLRIAQFIKIMDDDPTVLGLLDINLLMARIQDGSVNEGYYNVQELALLYAHPLMQKFPRAKQMHLMVEAFAMTALANKHNPAPFRLSEIAQMTTNIAAKGVICEDRIDGSDVKNLRNFHDCLVHLFNEIKHAPIPINPDFFRFITDNGLEIGESGCKFVIPQDTNVIRKWGTEQDHCIGTYAEHCAQNTTLLVGVWDTNNNQWIGHIQLSPIHLNLGPKFPDGSADRDVSFSITIKQFYGKHNAAVAQDIRDSVICYLEKSLALFIEARNVRMEEALELTNAHIEREKQLGQQATV